MFLHQGPDRSAATRRWCVECSGPAEFDFDIAPARAWRASAPITRLLRDQTMRASGHNLVAVLTAMMIVRGRRSRVEIVLASSQSRAAFPDVAAALLQWPARRDV